MLVIPFIVYLIPSIFSSQLHMYTESITGRKYFQIGFTSAIRLYNLVHYTMAGGQFIG